MIGKVSARKILFLVWATVFSVGLKAQPLLPDMIGSTQDGMNILSWTSQYDVIKSIAVQRSADSAFNFATIGYVKKLGKGPQAFIDGHPMPGANWYRLYIVFNSNLTWYSNYFKLEVDSAELLKQKVLPPNEALQQYASEVKMVEEVLTAPPTPGSTTTPSKPGTKNTETKTSAAPAKSTVTKPKLKLPSIETPEHPSVYIKSQYIFTNPFTGHVNVEIPEAAKHDYSITFFTDDNRRVIEIPRVREPSVIIDKRNFQHKGIYKFELFKNKEKLETGYITIY